MLTKVCTGCSTEKSLSEFSLHSKGKHGRNAKCKLCKNAIAKEYWLTNKNNLCDRKRHKRNTIDRFKQYGMSYEDYLLLYTEQKGCCKICALPTDALHIDHCHKTNKVRGLLCVNCNLGLGNFKDNVNHLKTAINYLEDGQAGNV